MSGVASLSHRRIEGERVGLRRVLMAGGPRNGASLNVLFLLGTASIVISAVIHLHLWMTGYSGIHIVGPLFLVQAMTGLAIAVTVIAFRRMWTAVIGFGYLVSTAAGFLVSLWIGLFGFQDTWSAPFAGTAFWTEVIGALVLAAGATGCVIKGFAEG